MLIHVHGQQILALLIIFSQSTGLDINYLKSSMIHINVVTEEDSTLANMFCCPFNKLPFTYLDLLVVTTRPRIVDLLPLADCIERRLTASSCFLAQDGMLKLLNYVNSFMPIYFLRNLHIPLEILKQFKRFQRQCFSTKYGQESDPSLVAWNLVYGPKKKRCL